MSWRSGNAALRKERQDAKRAADYFARGNEAPRNLMPRLREPFRGKPYLRRALGLLAGCGSEGCTEPVMRMHGFTADQLAELVHAGFADTTTERTLGEWRQPLEVKRSRSLKQATERSAEQRSARRCPLNPSPRLGYAAR